ncbi:MAG: 5-methyltetrahydropteroyltriglutamate--homocysteine S-methyltransferase [Campylobacteraceae bacterium]
MPKNSIVGFARIGEKRELKFALENFWANKTTKEELLKTAKDLREKHWIIQEENEIDLISSNDFSLYDGMLDMTVLLGAIPKRFQDINDDFTRYFSMAKGDEKRVAMEMTKWFNTNYHYIVPELDKNTTFSLHVKKIVDEYNEAKSLGINTKVNIVGIVTFLALSKSVDGSDKFLHFHKLLNVYKELVKELSKLNSEVYIQFDEPVAVTEVNEELKALLKTAYSELSNVNKNVKIIVSTYFDNICGVIKVLSSTDIWALGLDFVYGVENLDELEFLNGKKLIAGVVDGRNIWKNNFEDSLKLLEKIATKVPKKDIILSTSCSLLHVPYSLFAEEKMDSEIKNWLSFGVEKLQELSLLKKIFQDEVLLQSDLDAIEENKKANKSRKTSKKIHDESLHVKLKSFTKMHRDEPFETRIAKQKKALNYPTLATTTIGSFPQTAELRALRSDYKKGEIRKEIYESGIKKYIDDCVAFQEEIGLDVLVHGEPERNDMVEYFGEQLNGYVFSQNGWVQSYGSRCVKPPLLFGDISRPKPMTLNWITYAQSKTKKIMKGMLTGPVTILNWSFVRDDLPKADVAKQLAFALSLEIDDMQNAGIKIIQVDEAAFKEGYPLKNEKRKVYEKWALDAFKLATSVAKNETQIHTHMCYSNFNDIIKTIESMDADVISIETARAGNKILKVFSEVGYRQELGLGIYDIHSARIPSIEEMTNQINALLEVFPKEKLWINPDCGLKTRGWSEVKQSLKNMVKATKITRES